MAQPQQRPSSRPLSIGHVLERLKPEFPDLTPSKLRFLEEQGLVMPMRTDAGYRKYSATHIERIQLILEMQRDLYLPLRVIKQYLDALDAGKQPELPGSNAPQTASILVQRASYSRAELASEAGASVGLINDAISAKLIEPAERFGAEALTIVRALVELRKSGIEPRHLAGIRQNVQREIGLIERALMPVAKRADAASRQRASELAFDIAGQFEQIRSSLVRQILQREN